MKAALNAIKLQALDCFSRDCEIRCRIYFKAEFNSRRIFSCS